MDMIELFCTYFKKHKYKTYEDFILYLKKEYDGVENIDVKNITVLARKLQRRGILISKRMNDSLGKLCSVKEFNLEELKKQYNITLK